MEYLELADIAKSFKTFKVINDINLKIKKGEFVSLLGPSGCGKTTTLRIIAGFIKPDSGTVYLNGKNITNMDIRQRSIGMVFQSYALFPTMTVYDNIAFGLKVRKQPEKKIKEKVNQLLELGKLETFEKRYPSQLSGGQQQRVALLRALAIEPDILLLDEPLSNLDAKLRVEIRKEIKATQDLLNITTIYVTHDQEEALSISDQIAVMNSGIIQQFGKPYEIYNNPANKFVNDFIGRTNFISCHVTEERKIKFENFIFNLDVPQNIKEKNVFLSFRPQNIRINNKNIQDDNISFNLKLSAEIFLGNIYHLEGVTGGGEKIFFEIQAEEREKCNIIIGDNIIISVPKDKIHIFER